MNMYNNPENPEKELYISRAVCILSKPLLDSGYELKGDDDKSEGSENKIKTDPYYPGCLITIPPRLLGNLNNPNNPNNPI